MEIDTQYESVGDRSTQPASQNDLKTTQQINPVERKHPPRIV